MPSLVLTRLRALTDTFYPTRRHRVFLLMPVTCLLGFPFTRGARLPRQPCAFDYDLVPS